MSDFAGVSRYRNGLLAHVAVAVRNKGSGAVKQIIGHHTLAREIRAEAKRSFDQRLSHEEVEAIFEFLQGPHSAVPTCVTPDTLESYCEVIEKPWHDQILEHVKALNKLAYYEPKESDSE